ncbi:MAG: helix-hairpin-helix domain-containing protein [Candidatus Yanofskybacteria bacterium]|nr:helix-hairpin-helix domain-containing protein [Candidatus Yanofskybacteria bacterium]
MSYSKSINILKGGALIGALLIVGSTSVFAYDQNNTHPALTDEIVDFYNLNFPDKKLNEQDKTWLIQGSIDEDNNLRSVFHFYDPVHDKGIQSAYTAGLPMASSKKWALTENIQKNFYNSQQTGLAVLSNAPSVHDFSYQRAVEDYSKGDRKRGLFAFGHVLHLLEDAGVPDHTRNDAHPAFVHGEESPYETEMAKWSQKNFNIAGNLFKNKEKPVTFYTMESYFDRVANYSNSNFFSKDTISNTDYRAPTINNIKKLRIANKDNYFIVNTDPRTQKEFPIAILETKVIENKPKILNQFLVTEDIGPRILNGYWERLSKEVVLNGAGALNLFLNEAERAKEEYARNPKENTSLWAQLLGLVGIGDQALTTLNHPAEAGATGQAPEGRGTSDVNRGDTNGDTNLLPIVSPTLSPRPSVSPKMSPSPTPTKLVSPSVSPIPSPLSITEKVNINTANKELLMTLNGIKDAKSDAIIQYRQTQGQFQKIEDIMNVSGIGQATFNDIKDQITVGNIVPTPSPVPVYSGGGGGGGGSSSPSPTPTPTPNPTLSPTPTPSPTSTPTPSPEPDDDTANPGDVIINEIAWMGTTENSLCEWVELRNTTAQEINLAGWKLYEQDSSVEIISLTKKITPNGYYLIERETPTCSDPVPSVEADDSDSFGGSGLNNTSGEKLTLKDIAGAIIDEVDGSNGWKLNGDNEVIGDNTTKKTAQKIGNSWITASPTPKSENQLSTTTLKVVSPQAVTNLAATHGSPTITATWSAPDPGTYNTASLSYDLRYSSTSFSNAASASWWSAATQVASSSLPAVGEEGASQSASFDIAYEYGQTLYFALKTEVINITTFKVVSPQSNVATVNFASAIDDGAWAMFGKDQYHTSFAANISGPGPTAIISWEFSAGATIPVSQPVADADGNVYFGASDGTLVNSKIYSIRKEGENLVENWNYGTNVSIGTPTVLSDGTVYFGRIGAGGVLAFTALNSDGSKKWDYDNASTVRSVTVSPKGEPHFTYTSGTDKLAVLNPDGSEKILPISASGLAGFAPVVLDGGTIITAGKVSGNQFFTAYSSAGDQLWQVSYTGANGSTPADPSYDKSTGKTYSAAGPKLFAISQNPQDGPILNSNVHDIAPWNYYAATMVAISTDTLYVGFNNINPASGSLLYALNKSDLSTKWAAPFQADGLFNKQLAVDNAGNVYFSTQNGKLYGVNSLGNQLWAPINAGSNSTISPALTEHGLVWGYGSKITVIQ